MEDASENHASAILVGLENSAHLNSVTPAAATMDNARMEPAFVFPAGTEDTALWKVVLEVALDMVNAEWRMTVIGNASVSMDGMALTVPHSKRRFAMTPRTTTKVRLQIVHLRVETETLIVRVHLIVCFVSNRWSSRL